MLDIIIFCAGGLIIFYTLKYCGEKNNFLQNTNRNNTNPNNNLNNDINDNINNQQVPPKYEDIPPPPPSYDSDINSNSDINSDINTNIVSI